ncbi:MAG: nqrA [Chlamydiia bacterium]|nr:nqrA [Chlamydiia bacterium]
MSHIKVKRGLDIPMEGAPESGLQSKRHVQPLDIPKVIGFTFSSFRDVKFRVFVKPGDTVLIGQPLAEDKDVAHRMFVSPAAGVVKEVRRGEKRVLEAITIEVASTEEYVERDPLDIQKISRENLIQELLQGGLFASIYSRPFNRLANPQHPPRSIFVKAVESAPFVPPAEMQVEGREQEFETGLLALKKLTQGPVHLVFRAESSCKAFTEAKGVEKHTIEGPHPAGNVSLHIHAIDPILKLDDIVWTVTTLDVISIGSFILHGKIAIDRVIALAGTGVRQEMRGYYRARFGHSIEALVHGKMDPKEPQRIISGNVLTGDTAKLDDFLGVSHTTCTLIPDTTSRQFLSFFRLGKDKYTASGTYLSGHMNPKDHKWSFTTSQHGEERSFIDGSVYEPVMPMKVLTLELVRACMAEDYELADQYGLLEVDPEDFALPEFVCPSKIEMMNIVRDAQRQYAKDVLG